MADAMQQFEGVCRRHPRAGEGGAAVTRALLALALCLIKCL